MGESCVAGLRGGGDVGGVRVRADAGQPAERESVEADAGGSACSATAADELFGIDYVRRWHDDEGFELPCAADHTAGANERGAAVPVSGGFDSGSRGSAAERGAGSGEQAVSVPGRCGRDAGESSAGSLVFFLIFFEFRGDEAGRRWLAGCGKLWGFE